MDRFNSRFSRSSSLSFARSSVVNPGRSPASVCWRLTQPRIDSGWTPSFSPSTEEVVRYIDSRKDRWGVEPICITLQFASRTYYAAKRRPPCARKVRDEALKPKSPGSTARTSTSMG